MRLTRVCGMSEVLVASPNLSLVSLNITLFEGLLQPTYDITYSQQRSYTSYLSLTTYYVSQQER